MRSYWSKVILCVLIIFLSESTPLVLAASDSSEQTVTTESTAASEDCQMSEAARVAIDRAKDAAVRDGDISMEALDLIDKAEKAAGPPECDSTRAITLANWAIDLARIKFPEDTAGHRLPRGESEFGIELGLFTLGGTDFLITYRLKESPWLIGYRYAKWTETIGSFYDNDLENELSGLHARYLFNPEEHDTWYLAASLLKQSRKLTCEITGDSDSDSATGPYLGAGRMGRVNKFFHYNVGILLSPNETMSNDAEGCSNETTAIDINFAIGFTF